MNPERPRLPYWPCLYPPKGEERSHDAARESAADRRRREHEEAMARYLRGEGDCPATGGRWA